MSSRALRKAQKKQEEERLQHQINDDEEDEFEEGPSTGKASMFAMLDQADDGNADDENEERAEDVDSPMPEHDTTTEISQPATPKSSSKKKKKKRKAKAPTPAPESEQPLDILEQDDPATNSDFTKGNLSSFEKLCKLLSISQQHLHVLNEMKNLFGRDLVEAEEREARAEAARARRGGRAAVNNRLAAIARRRNLFIQGKEDWPAVPSGGLGMEVVERRPHGVVEYRFVHSTAYQDVQRQFEICVQSMDPSRMIVLLQHNPWHIATLLQVSDIAKQSRQHSDAGDLLERALFSFGRAVHSTFAEKLSQGKARLDFRRPENREFWLASWRYIDNLRMRATWRTVYEWAKMLLSLDPERDPYCVKLVIDQFAIRARQARHFLELMNHLNFDQSLYASFGLDPSQCSVVRAKEELERYEYVGEATKSVFEADMDGEMIWHGVSYVQALGDAFMTSRDRNLTAEGIPYPYANILATKALAYLQLDAPLLANDPDINTKIAKYHLKEAMETWPSLFARLFQELQIDPIPPSIWGKQPPGPNEDLASKLYVSRAKDLWNTPEAMSLLIQMARNLKLDNWKPDPEPPIPLFEQAGPVRHVILHVMLTEQPQFISLLPTQPTNEQLRSSDPYPPLNNLLSYDAQASGPLPHAPASMEEQLRALEEQMRRAGLINREGPDQDDGDEPQAPGGFDDEEDEEDWSEE